MSRSVVGNQAIALMPKLVPADARRRNRALVLQALYPDRHYSRAQIAKMTGLTRVTVSDLVTELIKSGLIEEEEFSETPSRALRRGLHLNIVPDGRHIVVLDLSQPYVLRGAVMNLMGQIILRNEIALANSRSISLKDITNMCLYLIKRTNTKILGIGVSCPGTVSRNGIILQSVTYRWTNFNLSEFIESKTGLPVIIDNDANVAVLGERRFGDGGPDMMLVEITRGLGAGILSSDQLLLGANMAAGEIGHVIVDENGPVCMCGRRGCLGAIVSVPALTSRIAADPNAEMSILRDAGHILGKSLAISVGALDLTRVIIAGSSNVVNQIFIQAVQKEFDKRIQVGFGEFVRVSRSKLGSDITLLGACALVLENRLGFRMQI